MRPRVMTGLYIHIPYCHSKCAYCDFFSTPRRDSLDQLISSLVKEWEMRRNELAEPPSTLYVGGGTPSILTLEKLSELIVGIEQQNWIESTIECNPEDVTHDWIDGIKELGFNRVSMGVQSLDDDQLRFIGRRHTAYDALQKMEMLLQHDINVSVDLIYGLPQQTLQSWRKSLDGILALHPHHLSAYLLGYEQGTRLWAMLQANKVEEASDELVCEMYKYLCERTDIEGYVHYEVSNFAQPGCKAVHNSNYWNGSPYLGLGPGAHSYDGNIRRINPSSIKRYLEAISHDMPAYEIDAEGDVERLNDFIITRLRTNAGLSIKDLVDEWGEELADAILKDAQPHLASGMLVSEGGRLFIPPDCWLRSDAVMRDLIRVQ